MEEQTDQPDLRTPYEVASDNMLEGLRADGSKPAHPLCLVRFGVCGERKHESFGNAKTIPCPHVCGCGKRHLSKLHICGICGDIGAVIEPTKFSAAGREYRRYALQNRVTSAAARVDSGFRNDMMTLAGVETSAPPTK